VRAVVKITIELLNGESFLSAAYRKALGPVLSYLQKISENDQTRAGITGTFDNVCNDFLV